MDPIMTQNASFAGFSQNTCRRVVTKEQAQDGLLMKVSQVNIHPEVAITEAM